MTVLYRNPCYSEGSYNEVDLYLCCEMSNENHYVNVSVLIKFSQKTSVFTLIIINTP